MWRRFLVVIYTIVEPTWASSFFGNITHSTDWYGWWPVFLLYDTERRLYLFPLSSAVHCLVYKYLKVISLGISFTRTDNLHFLWIHCFCSIFFVMGCVVSSALWFCSLVTDFVKHSSLEEEKYGNIFYDLKFVRSKCLVWLHGMVKRVNKIICWFWALYL